MKNNIFKNSVISMLSVFILLLLSSQAVLAVKPGTVVDPVPTTPTAVIDSVVLDITSSTIVVTGAELGSITTVTLGGLEVSFTSSTDGNTGVINFTDIDAATAAVLTAGNYSLVLGDNIFSIYLSSTDAAAITPLAIDGSCPCIDDWETYGENIENPLYGIVGNEFYDGFRNATPSCAYDTTDQVQVQFSGIGELSEIWVLDTQFDSSTGTGQCALVNDISTRTLDSEEQHNACASYLRTQYITSTTFNCGTLYSY